MKAFLIGLGVLSLILLWFARIICYHLWWRKWSRLPGRNPYKPGDSE